MSLADELARRVGARRVGVEWRTQCPLHADERPSLDFRDGDAGGVVFTCRSAGCGSADLAKHFREAHPDLLKQGTNGDSSASRQEWALHDADGRHVATHARYRRPGGEKGYAWQMPDGTRGLGGMKAAQLPLYGVRDVLAAKRDAEGEAEAPLVVVTEGENDCDAAAQLGFVAAATVTGASGLPSDDSLRHLVGCRVILWPDADPPGQQHFRRLEARLKGLGVDIVGWVAWPDAPKGGGAADFRGSRDGALALVNAPDVPTPEGGRPEHPQGASGGLQVFTVGELFARCAPTQEWLLERFIPLGGYFVLLAAFMKVGKTTFLYALIAAILRGAQFIGQPTRRVPVLLLAVEEHEGAIRRGLERFGVGAGALLYIHTGPLINTPTTMKALSTVIEKHGIKLVVLDTLGRFLGLEDENDNAQVMRHAGAVLDLCRATGATFLASVHASKAGGDHGREIRGASALFGLADQALILDRRKGGSRSHRILRTLGRFDETPEELVLDFDGERTYSVLGSPEDADMDVAARRLADALSDEPQTYRELATATELSQAMVRKLVKRMQDVEVTGEGKRGDPHRVRRADSFLNLAVREKKGSETEGFVSEPVAPLRGDTVQKSSTFDTDTAERPS